MDKDNNEDMIREEYLLGKDYYEDVEEEQEEDTDEKEDTDL